MSRDDVDSFMISKGIALDEIGLRQVGLTRADALSAISLIEKASLPILGGDVYLQHVSARMTPAYANWYCNRKPNEVPRDYLARSWSLATAYVRDYPNPPQGEPLFVLVLGKPP
jgi:hypothetical protein